MATRVLIADDYAPFRVMLRYLLDAQEEIEVAGEATDGREAVELAHDLEPDVIMLDLAMPNLSGWEAIPLLRQVAPETKIVVLSGFPEERMRDPALRSSISSYLEKGEPEDRILGAIHEAALAPC